MKVIFDTDTNNELDDQHALAYLLFNRHVFDIKAVTVNATYRGGNIQAHFDEAKRVMDLCNTTPEIPLLKGANGNFSDIDQLLNKEGFDGHLAVQHIIDEALNSGEGKMVFLAVGKLTNIALALKKEPKITRKIRLVWLGSNFPDPGEYNLGNDEDALNYMLESDMDFEIVTVGYGKTTGTDIVRVTYENIMDHMPGSGVEIPEVVIGRHGGKFTNFGDYSMSLFDHCTFNGDPPSRALHDMVAVAIVKNKKWAKPTIIPAPIVKNKQWRLRPENSRRITVWENFDAEKILSDFYQSFSIKPN